MAQSTFNNLDTLLTARTTINGNATDAESRLIALEGEQVNGYFLVSSIADLAVFKTGTVYNLPANMYLFAEDISFGTDTINLDDQNGIYTFMGAHFNQLTYTGTAAFISTTETGVSLDIIRLFLTTANATCIELSNGNSCILEFPVFINCKRCVDLDTMSFCTGDKVAMVACENGIRLDDVLTCSMQVGQWSLGQDNSGIAYDILGASSERFFLTSADSRPTATESFINIQATYGGLVDMVAGVHDSGGGDFFESTGRNQTDLNIDAQHIKNVPNSRIIGSLSSTDNSGTVSISEDVWTDFNQTGGGACVAGANIERWSLNNATTGQLEYDGSGEISAVFGATLSFVPDGSKNYEFRLVKNGAVLSPAQIFPASGQGGANESVSLLVPMTAETNDLFRVQVQCIDGDDDLDITNLAINIQ